MPLDIRIDGEPGILDGLGPFVRQAPVAIKVGSACSRRQSSRTTASRPYRRFTRRSTDEAAFAERLQHRLGHAPSSTRVFAGFDPSDALVVALVSEAMCATLAIIAVLPASPIAAGLDVNVEQRFFA